MVSLSNHACSAFKRHMFSQALLRDSRGAGRAAHNLRPPTEVGTPGKASRESLERCLATRHVHR